MCAKVRQVRDCCRRSMALLAGGKEAEEVARSDVVRTGPHPDDEHEVVYFKLEDGSAPGRMFLSKVCPPKVRLTMRAVLVQVAAAPPRKFSGGGYWEKMHGDMAGWYEVRVDGPRRHHYRLFCLLDYEAKGQAKPLLVVIDGRDKPFRTELSPKDYRQVRELGELYLAENPRSIE